MGVCLLEGLLDILCLVGIQIYSTLRVSWIIEDKGSHDLGSGLQDTVTQALKCSYSQMFGSIAKARDLVDA